ncbi:MAG: dethiobiotin synthase [Cytophagaceae bacterium]
MKKYFVTAISTDSGKTLVSAILVNALQADYWKPVQSGAATKDSDAVKKLVYSGNPVFHPETYCLEAPLSPHAAAALEGVTIDLNKIKLPDTEGHPLVIEGAGGIMVPLNNHDLVLDLIKNLDVEVVLVSNHYLGSINHTLLTAEVLKQHQIKVKGIIFNGEPNPATESIILEKTGYVCLLRIPKLAEVTPEIVYQYSVRLFDHWNDD